MDTQNGHQAAHKAPWWAFLTGRRATPAMGRLLLLVAFLISCAAWIVSIVKAPGTFPDGLREVILGLLAYTLGGKFVPAKEDNK